MSRTMPTLADVCDHAVTVGSCPHEVGLPLGMRRPCTIRLMNNYCQLVHEEFDKYMASRRPRRPGRIRAWVWQWSSGVVGPRSYNSDPESSLPAQVVGCGLPMESDAIS